MTVWLEDTEIFWKEDSRLLRREGQPALKYSGSREERGSVWLDGDRLHYADEDGRIRKLTPSDTARVQAALR